MAMAARSALAPDLLARTRPIGDSFRGQGGFQRFAGHPGHHQDLAGGGGLGNRGHQAAVVEADGGKEGIMGQRIGHGLSLRRARPRSRSAIRSSASSSPAWMRMTGPSAANEDAVRSIWLGKLRLSNPPPE